MSNMMSGGMLWGMAPGYALHPARPHGAGDFPLLHTRQMRQGAGRITLAASGETPALRSSNLPYDNVRCRAQGEHYVADPFLHIDG